MIATRTDLTDEELQELVEAIAEYFPREYAEWDKFEIATLHSVGIPALTVMLRDESGHQRSVLMPSDWW